LSDVCVVCIGNESVCQEASVDKDTAWLSHIIEMSIQRSNDIVPSFVVSDLIDSDFFVGCKMSVDHNWFKLPILFKVFKVIGLAPNELAIGRSNINGFSFKFLNPTTKLICITIFLSLASSLWLYVIAILLLAEQKLYSYFNILLSPGTVATLNTTFLENMIIINYKLIIITSHKCSLSAASITLLLNLLPNLLPPAVLLISSSNYLA